jgi:ABC-type Fe3+ transport system substrate-binding protein
MGCRYITRPALSDERVQLNAAGQVELKLKMPWRDGTTHLVMIPADAPHPENAHKWIDYIMRPEVQAAITNKVMFTSPNAAARPLIRPEVLANMLAFPPGGLPGDQGAVL